jgi:hypothetical protein
MLGTEIVLTAEPFFPSLYLVPAKFARDHDPRRKLSHRPERDPVPIDSNRLQLGQVDVERRFVNAHERPSMRLDYDRTSSPPCCCLRQRPVLACDLPPPDSARGTDTEPYRNKLPTIAANTRSRRYTDHAGAIHAASCTEINPAPEIRGDRNCTRFIR